MNADDGLKVDWGQVDREVLNKTALDVFRNAEQLFEDAKHFEEWGRFPTAYALGILAQEEYGKAFLLHLAMEQAVPWTDGLDRALRNHRCKQLVALVMEFLQRKDFMELLEDPDRFRGASTLPEYVLDAIHVIVHEHIRELNREDWLDDSDRRVHPVANRIARGILDREKQAGFYVHVGSDGKIRKNPSMVTAERCRSEIARTERVAGTFCFYDGALRTSASFELPKIIATFQALSGLMPVEEFNEKWWP